MYTLKMDLKNWGQKIIVPHNSPVILPFKGFKVVYVKATHLYFSNITFYILKKPWLFFSRLKHGIKVDADLVLNHQKQGNPCLVGPYPYRSAVSKLGYDLDAIISYY